MSTNESETGMTEHLHYISHTHDTGYGIKTRFTCKGGRTSPCHQYTDCLCTFAQVPCAHERALHDECWMQGWMDKGCSTDCAPDGDPVRSGPITVTWNGICVEWEYATEATA